jgi:hypothetical protein
MSARSPITEFAIKHSGGFIKNQKQADRLFLVIAGLLFALCAVSLSLHFELFSFNSTVVSNSNQLQDNEN